MKKKKKTKKKRAARLDATSHRDASPESETTTTRDRRVIGARAFYGCTSLEFLNLYGVRGFEGLGAGDDAKEAKRLVKALKKALSAPTLCAKAVVEGRTKTCDVTI